MNNLEVCFPNMEFSVSLFSFNLIPGALRRDQGFFWCFFFFSWLHWAVMCS